MYYENQNEYCKYSSYLNLYLLYFDYYSHGFLGIWVFGALDVLNKSFKHLTLPLRHWKPNIYLPVCSSFLLENLFTPYEFYPFGQINQCPDTIDLHGLHPGLQGLKLFLGVGSLHGLYIGDRILIVLIKFNRITILDQKIIVSVQLQ